MNKILIVSLLIGLFVIGSTSAYFCLEDKDNPQVQEFKMKVNAISIKNDFNNGLSEEQITTKLKYFSPCRFR